MTVLTSNIRYMRVLVRACKLTGNHLTLDPCQAKVSPWRSASGRQRFKAVVTKAVGDSSDSSSGSIVKSVRSAAIDKLPVIPSTLEFIGVLFSWWFTYRYLLKKLDREELVAKIKISLSDIIGQ